MKKILVLLVILIFASCSNSLQITKRHYLKGYYVSHQKHHKEKNAVAASSKKVNIVEPKITLEAPSNISDLSEPTLQSAKRDRSTAKVSKNTPQLLASAKPKENAAQTTINSKLKTNPFLVKRLEHVAQPSSGEGRSLFWIVVLVLLILWALGIISGSFGIGILFNLLLLIALVLLILWLLRIV